MRIIPKNTKVKMQFYKGIGLWDVLIGGIALGFIALAMTSNLPNNYVISLVILIITAPLFIPIGEIKVYHAIGYGLRFLIADKKFSRRDKGKKNIGAIVPYANIRDNVILQKDGIYTGVIQITPIEFNMLSLNKQNYLIDGVISNTLKNVGVFQEYNLLKLEKPVILDDYVNNELTRINKLIVETENNNLTEDEFRDRVAIIEDRTNLINSINSEEKIYSSFYYIALHDIDTKSLNNSLDLIEQSLNSNGLEAKRLNNKELAVFLKYSYDKDFD